MTPEQEEQVRRALSAAVGAERAQDGDGPPATPAHVVARLDGVLSDLVAERSSRLASTPGPGRDEGTVSTSIPETVGRRGRRRRARSWPNALVAAAAVAVIAVAGGTVATRGLGEGDTGSSSTAGKLQDESGGSTADQGEPETGDGSPPGASPGGAPSRALAAHSAPRLRSATLTADVQRLVDAGAARRRSPSDVEQDGEQPDDRRPCTPPTVVPGADVVDVRLDGKPATLVLAVPSNGRRTARVYSCADGSTPVASTTVRQR